MKIRPIFKTIDIFSFIQFLSRQTNYIIKFFLLKVLYLVRCPIMLYRAEICFVEKDNKGSNSGLVTIIFAIHSLECIKYFPVTAFHLFRQRIIVSNKVLVGRPPSFDRDIDKTPLRNICY